MRISLDELIAKHVDKLSVGRIVFFGTWERISLSEMLSGTVEGVIGQIASNADLAVRKFYADGYPKLHEEAKSELTELIERWSSQYLPKPHFYRVFDKQEYVITEADMLKIPQPA